MMNFQILLNNMESMGFFQYLFPFLLALAIIYGAFQVSVKDRLPKSAQAMVSIILAFFVMLYSSWNSMIVGFLTNMSGSLLVIGSGILFILILAGLVGFDPWKDILNDDKRPWLKIGAALLVIFFLILVLMGSGAGWLIPLPAISMGSQFWTAVFVIAILAIAFWFMTRKGESSEGDGGEKDK